MDIDLIVTTTVAAVSLLLFAAIFGFMIVRNRRTLHVVLRQKETDLNSVIRLTHHLLCAVFALSTVFLLTIKVTVIKDQSLGQELVDILLQYVVMAELNVTLAESLFNFLCRKRAKRRCGYFKATAILAIFGIPLLIIAPQFITANWTRNDPALSSLTSDNTSSGHVDYIMFPPRQHEIYTNSHLASSFATNRTSAGNQSVKFRSVYVPPKVTDPLLSIRPKINAEKRAMLPLPTETRSDTGDSDQTQPGSFETTPRNEEIQRTTAQLPSQRLIGYEYFLNYPLADLTVEAIKSDTACWITCAAASTLVTFIAMLLLAICVVVFAVVECVALRKVEKSGQQVPLDEWFVLICRPFLAIITCLKWTAVMLECYSHSSVYSIYVTWLMTPLMIYVIAGARRSRLDDHIIGRCSKRFTSLKAIELRTRRPHISDCHLTTDVGYTNVSSCKDTTMLQIHEPGRSHVQDGVRINQCLNDFVRDHFETSSEETMVKLDNAAYDQGRNFTPCALLDVENNNNIAEDEGYGIIRPNQAPVADLTNAMAKCEVTEEKRTSVFDDSDYDEVIDFMTSPDPKSSEETQTPLNGLTPILITTDDIEIDSSSKRSSSTSVSESVTSTVSSTALSTSGVESGEERPASKYAELDIAKILHTRKRIHRILQFSPESAGEPEAPVEETPIGYTNGKKKSSYLSKRHTHYGTVGRRRKTTTPASRRFSSTSRPTSTGEGECVQFHNGDYSTYDPLRSNIDDNCFTYDARASRRRTRDSESEERTHSNRSSGAFDTNKRWSRLSSNSQNSDKTQLTPGLGSPRNRSVPTIPVQGPWKAFRKFVNSSGSSSRSSQAYEEIKATIHIRHNSSCNNNNNNCKLDDVKFVRSRGEVEAEEDKSKNMSYSCLSAGSLDTSVEYTYSPASSVGATPPSNHSTNSLMRRFSRKSLPRGRSPGRRTSLPTQSAWDVRSGNWRDCTASPARQDAPLPRFQYGDGAQRSDIENMVMESVESRVEQEKSKPDVTKPSNKTNSFRKRLMSSFKRKRTSSQDRKSLSKSKDATTPEKGQMSKALSYSSPQLSVFAVNGTKGPAQKLVF